DPLGKLAGNPCEGIKQLYSGDRSEIIWTAVDIAHLKSSCAPEIAHAVDLASHTGLRLGDLLRLSWSHVGDDAITITTGKSKHRREALVPLYGALREVLERIPRRSTTILTNSRRRPNQKRLRCAAIVPNPRLSGPSPAAGAHIADCRIFGKVPPRFPERKAPPGDGAKFRIKIAKLSSPSRLMAGKFCTGLDRCQPRGLSFCFCVTAGAPPPPNPQKKDVWGVSAPPPPPPPAPAAKPRPPPPTP